MKQIANTLFQSIRFKVEHALKHSVSFKVVLLLGVLTGVISLPWPGTQARQGGFQRGDVFVSLTDGLIQRYSPSSGALLQTLNTGTGTGSFITGGAFDRSANFYATAFSSRSIVRFDANGVRLGEFGSGFNGRPESIIFDADGNAFVGTVDGDNDIRKFDAAGNPLDRYDVTVERRGSDWIDLAADKCTLYYTSEGARILRYNVCTKTQLGDFVNNLPHPAAYAVRLLPSGGLLVADTNEILRLDATGAITQRYDAPGEDSWFAANLDPDGTSFWSGGISTGNVYKFDIASGNQITRIPTGQGAIFGVTILGELTVVNPTPSPTATATATATPTPPIEGAADLALSKAAAPSVVTNGTLVTYTLRINNAGPAQAVNAVLSDTLPLNTTLVSCSTGGNGVCGGAGRNRTVTFALLPLGETTVTLVARVDCPGIESSVLTNNAQVTAANFDPNSGAPIVLMEMNAEGAERWADITGRNIKKRVAIVLDGSVYSAPTVQNKIAGGSSQITGSQDINEANLLSIILKAGALKAPIKIIEERLVGPSLGEDSIRQGLNALLLAAGLVILFMAIYYAFGGIVADAAVILNVLMTLAILAAFGATLTLPGIGGIVLTIGMAVDANILIYERIREELSYGKALKNAVEIGYEKAFVAIFDSNVTTFMTGVILYAFGSGPIQGFAVTLMIGIAVTLFTAVYMTKTLFMVMLDRGTSSLNFGQPKLRAAQEG